MRSPNSTTFTSSGIGSGSSDTVVVRPMKRADVLDDDFAAHQRALQRRPTERLGQQGARVDQDHAAVGAMQRAGLDQAEIGDQRALHLQILDAAEQVAERRVQFLDHRRGRGPAWRDQHVDLVAVERAAEAHGGQRRFRRGRRRLHEQRQVLQQVGARWRRCVRRTVGRSANAAFTSSNGCAMANCAVSRSSARTASRCSFSRRGMARSVSSRSFSSSWIASRTALLLRFRPGVELCRRHHLAVARRRHGEADRRAQDGDAVCLRLFVERGEGLSFFSWIDCSMAPRRFW